MDSWLGRLADLVAQAPTYQQLGLAFLGGLLTSANPCVLVAAPRLVGFTGGTKEGRYHLVVLSAVFMLGLAAAFTILGLIAALTGSLMGDVGWGWKALLGLILIVALQKKVLWGGVLLFAYALGHVLLLFLARALSGWASKYAESHFSGFLGRWLPKGMGLLLTGCALWVLLLAWKTLFPV